MERFFPSVAASFIFLTAACDTPATTTADTSQTLNTDEVGFFAQGQVAEHSNINLTSKAAEAYRSFRETPKSYGAMYVTPNGRAWGWHRNALSLANAQGIAKTICDIEAKTNCVLYASISPVAPPNANDLPPGTRNSMQEAVDGTDFGNFVAVAHSQSGSFGYGWDFSTRSAARDRAIKECNIAIQKDRADRSKAAAREYDRKGFFDCKIIRTYRGR